jgi:3-(3-hydroxy-phenyl)propionate hydroxylase
VVVCEKFPELNEEIRASTLHPPTLEMLQAWGVVDEVLATGYPVASLTYWERASRQRIAAFDYAAIANDTLFPYRLQCPQHILTRVLLPHLQQMPHVRVLFDHELVSFEQGEAAVSAHCTTPNGLQTIVGSYLCAADGANSTIRTQLGLAFEGMTYADRFLLIGTDYDFGTLFPGFGPVNYIFDPEEWVIILRLPDLARVVFRLRQEEVAEEAMAEAALRQRMWRFIGDEVPFDIKTTQLYRVHQRVAETFRQGRVLLLGDAAHINNPAGGMGMNSGIHDAYALAGRLTAVLSGQPDTLLDEYSQIRRAVAMKSIQQYTDKNYQDLSATDPAYRQKRNEELLATATDPARAREYLLRASMLGDRI